MKKPDWSDAPNWAAWLAMDANGQWNWWEEKPEITSEDHDCWLPTLEQILRSGNQDEFAGIGGNGYSWKESLEPRP